MGVLSKHLREVNAELKKNPGFWRCQTHGPARPGAWGCPDCTRELREQNERLTTAARLAVETLEWAAERALVHGGSGWKAEVIRCKAAQTALKKALREYAP